MKVSFDGLRRKLLMNYNSLTKKLNNNISDCGYEIDSDYNASINILHRGATVPLSK